MQAQDYLATVRIAGDTRKEHTRTERISYERVIRKPTTYVQPTWQANFTRLTTAGKRISCIRLFGGVVCFRWMWHEETCRQMADGLPTS